MNPNSITTIKIRCCQDTVTGQENGKRKWLCEWSMFATPISWDFSFKGKRVKKINQSYSLMIIVLKLQGGTTTMFTVNNNIKINIDYYHKVTVRREFL